MWKRRQPKDESDRAAVAIDPARELLMLALQEMAGSARGLVYEVPSSQRPFRVRFNSTRVSGGPAWEGYLRARRRLDDGALTLVVSLRGLDEDERRLVIDWGSAYSNSFLLVEPRPTVPALIGANGELSPLLRNAIEATDVIDTADSIGWIRSTPLGVFLRQQFGIWVRWPSPLPSADAVEDELGPMGPIDTLALRLLRLIAHEFPQNAFNEAIGRLHYRERELFGGPVPRARSAFRSRLGLPILHDPYCADRALRTLVNQGKVTVHSRRPVPRLSFGYGSPVPDDLPDEDFEQLIMA